MKLFTDYHTHPQGHRLQPYTLALLQPWIDSARANNLTDIAFTDHDRYHAGVNFDVIDELRAKNPDVAIRIGIELDNDPETSAAGRAWVEKNWDKLDFVLGSIHYLHGQTTMFDDAAHKAQIDSLGSDNAYENYVRQLAALIAAGHIDCLSHLDLIKIHGHRPAGFYMVYFEPILQLIKKKGLAMEINTAGWRKPVGQQYPEFRILRRALALGIPLTISSDAHSHVQLAEGYTRLQAQFIMDGITLPAIATFQHHQATLVPQ